MTTESVLQFLIEYNIVIIQWSVAIIVILSTVLLFWMVFRQPKHQPEEAFSNRRSSRLLDSEASQAGTGDQNLIKEKSALEGNGKDGQASLTADAEGRSQSDHTAIDLKSGPRTAEKAEEKINASPPQGLSVADDPEKVELKKRLKSSELLIVDLEGKLKEYEILEDDIADLSRYREENEKLKEKLAELGASLGEPDENIPIPAESVQSAIEPEPSLGEQLEQDEDLLAEFQKAIDEQNQKTEQKAAELGLDVPASKPSTETETIQSEGGGEPSSSDQSLDGQDAVDRLFADVEADVEKEKEVSAEAATAPLEDETPMEFANDLLAEFDQGPEEVNSEESVINLLDTDKMLEEIAALAEETDEVSSEEALAEELDTDKMAQEASQLEAVKETS